MALVDVNHTGRRRGKGGYAGAAHGRTAGRGESIKGRGEQEEKAERIKEGGRRGERGKIKLILLLYHITFYQVDSQPVGGLSAMNARVE